MAPAVHGPWAARQAVSDVRWLAQPCCWVLGTAQRQEGPCLPRAALPGPPVAGRPAASWPCSLLWPASRWLRCPESEPGNGSVHRGGGVAAAPGSWGEPQSPACPHLGLGAGVGSVLAHVALPWPGLDLTRAWRRGWSHSLLHVLLPVPEPTTWHGQQLPIKMGRAVVDRKGALTRAQLCCLHPGCPPRPPGSPSSLAKNLRTNDFLGSVLLGLFSDALRSGCVVM